MRRNVLVDAAYEEAEKALEKANELFAKADAMAEAFVDKYGVDDEDDNVADALFEFLSKFPLV